jgi:steroid delta-isomerase
MTHIELFSAYLRHYADKNLEAISDMLAEDVHLRDWNISVFGKAEALRETAKNFAEAESVEIHFLTLYENADTVAGELHIIVDGKIDLYVVDVLTFDAQGKVTAIRSYKGRGD